MAEGSAETSHSFKAGGRETKAADTAIWSSSDLRGEVVESKVELKAAVESMKDDLLKEVATILKAQAEEHSKALAQVQVTKTETRTAGARRAAGGGAPFPEEGEEVCTSSFLGRARGAYARVAAAFERR